MEVTGLGRGLVCLSLVSWGHYAIAITRRIQVTLDDNYTLNARENYQIMPREFLMISDLS